MDTDTVQEAIAVAQVAIERMLIAEANAEMLLSALMHQATMVQELQIMLGMRPAGQMPTYH